METAQTLDRATRLVGAAALAGVVGILAGCPDQPPPVPEPPRAAASAAEGAGAAGDADARRLPPVPNAAEPLADVFTGGAPEPDALGAIKAQGVRTIVDLRTPAEGTRAEGQACARLGMHYVPIPVAGPEDLTVENARALAVVLDRPGARPALVHCASGNRVGALVAIMAARVHGRSAEDALALGRAAGLTGLEPAVRERLGLGSE